MGFLGDVFDFLTNHDQWHGNESIPTLAGQHLQLTIFSVLAAAVVALPIGIVLGHVRTGGAVAVNIANIGRALPALALLILSVQWVGIGEPTGILSPVQSIPAFIAMFALAVPPMLANAYVGMASAVPLVMAGVRTAAVAVVATATLAAYVDAGGFGRYIVDGFAVNDNVKVFAGGFLVALLAIAIELVLALVQRALTSPGIRTEGRIKVRELATDRLAPATGPAL